MITSLPPHLTFSSLSFSLQLRSLLTERWCDQLLDFLKQTQGTTLNKIFGCVGLFDIHKQNYYSYYYRYEGNMTRWKIFLKFASTGNHLQNKISD